MQFDGRPMHRETASKACCASTHVGGLSWHSPRPTRLPFHRSLPSDMFEPGYSFSATRPDGGIASPVVGTGKQHRVRRGPLGLHRRWGHLHRGPQTPVQPAGDYGFRAGWVGGSPYPGNVGVENRAGLRRPIADPLWCDPDAAAQTQPANGKNPGNGGTQVGQATKGNGERPVLFWVAGGCAATAVIVALAYVLTTPPHPGRSRGTVHRGPLRRGGRSRGPRGLHGQPPKDGEHRGGG